MDAANRAIGFFRDVLKLAGGDYENIPFILLDWQSFVVGSLFGWKGDDGYRRFRMAYVEGGKGSGKSPLAAGIGMYMLTADREQRAEVYAAASKKDQAMVLFRDAVAMAKLSPALRKRIIPAGGPGREWNLAFHQTGSFFRPISSEDGQSGPRPSCGLLDEIHEHRDNIMVEMLRAGTKGRNQALIFMITNSGSDRTGVCWQYHTYAIKVAAGDLEDETFFSMVFSLDEGDDPFKDETCWVKANPSLGITIKHKYLEEQVTQARGMPSKEAIVRRLNFCQWTDAVSPWIDNDLWEACQEDFDEDDMIGLPCWGSLDLSAKRDLTAFGKAWVDTKGLMYLSVAFWTPKETLEERSRRDSVPYAVWEKEGHLFTTPGRSISKDIVAGYIQEFVAKHTMLGVAFDPAMMDEFIRACDQIGLDCFQEDVDANYFEGDGLRLVKHGQGFSGLTSNSTLWMPRSISALEDRFMKRTIRIKPNPVLRWNSASAVLTADPQENRKWDKRKASGRIDGIVAASMACGAHDQRGELGTIPDDYEPQVWG